MKIVATSDWHGYLPETLPEGDVLVIAGDLLPIWDHTYRGQTEWVLEKLLPYFGTLDYEHIVFVAGNHDFGFRDVTPEDFEVAGNIHYLKDSGVTINGLKFWGCPWSVYLPRWEFMLREEDLANHWSMIPDDTHVLIVHGPPYGSCDFTSPRYGSKHVGSRTLRERIEELDLQLVITGHIHEGYGSDLIGNTHVKNVALVDIEYNPTNAPMVLVNEGG